jgi:hypothetical protein
MRPRVCGIRGPNIFRSDMGRTLRERGAFAEFSENSHRNARAANDGLLSINALPQVGPHSGRGLPDSTHRDILPLRRRKNAGVGRGRCVRLGHD